MPKYQQPPGFKFDSWRNFLDYLTEKDVQNLEQAEKLALRDVENACDMCGEMKVRFIDDLSTKMSSRCCNCGRVRRYEPIVVFKDW